MTKKIGIIQRGRPMIIRDMTPDEMEGAEKAKLEAEVFEKNQEGRTAKIDAYIDAGWKDPFDLIDDILENGIEHVKMRREEIKNKLSNKSFRTKKEKIA